MNTDLRGSKAFDIDQPVCGCWVEYRLITTAAGNELLIVTGVRACDEHWHADSRVAVAVQFAIDASARLNPGQPLPPAPPAATPAPAESTGSPSEVRA